MGRETAKALHSCRPGGLIAKVAAAQMDVLTASALNAMNTVFYTQVNDSFSATRSNPWAGWARLFDYTEIPHAGIEGSDAMPYSVLDVACGNMRFARFLETEFDNTMLRYCAIDNCDSLANAEDSSHYRHKDLVGSFCLNASEETLWPESRFDLVVCFGFMHHIPGRANRRAFLRKLVESANEGGTIAISLWRFMSDERLASKAQACSTEALDVLNNYGGRAEELEEGDFFLPWQHENGVFRYCHHFDESEIQELIDCVDGKAQLIARYEADGRSGTLNTYLVLKSQSVQTSKKGPLSQTLQNAGRVDRI